MAVLFKRGTGTSTNIDSDVPKPSVTNGSGARKFLAPDLTGEQEVRGVDLRNNSDLVSATAHEIDALRISLLDVSAAARISLETIRDDLSVSSPKNEEGTRRSVLLQERYVSGSPEAREIADDVPGSVFKKRSDQAPNSSNVIVPSLDRVLIDLDKNIGTVDCFFCKLNISLPVEHVTSGKVKALRLFRSTIISPNFLRGAPPVLSAHGLELLTTLKMRSSTSARDQSSTIEHRYREVNVRNSLTIVNPLDPETNTRLSTDTSFSFTPPDGNSAMENSSLTTSDDIVSSFVNGDAYSSLDRSVARDLNSLRNIKNSDISSPKRKISHVFSVDALYSTSVDDLGNAVMERNNSQEFREILFVSLDKLRSHVVGGSVEFSFVDDTIGFGRAYRYYAVSVDEDMFDSVRSQIVEVVIEGLRVPERPSDVRARIIDGIATMTISVDDRLVEKFEIYRKDETPSVSVPDSIISRDMSTAVGMNTDISQSDRMENGYIKLGESLNFPGAGSSFYDRNISPGRRHKYRIYSVDIFGNKSESPWEEIIFVSERSLKQNELQKPFITAEVDSTTHKARLTFGCVDPRVHTLRLSRKDLTIFQKAFVTPSQSGILKFGAPRNNLDSFCLEDVILRGENKDVSWTGVFENLEDEIIFIDKTVSLDHVYQYKVVGVDIYGNMTADEITRPLMIVRRPLVNSPTNFKADVLQGPDFTVGGIQLSWQDGNSSISSEDMLGNRDDLRNSSVRTVYQLERKEAGLERWEQFPLIEGQSFFDASSQLAGVGVLKFRPPLVKENVRYSYRVKALQTGSFVSNFSVSADIFATLPIISPVNFRIRASFAKVSPPYAVLNWDTSKASPAVDRWEIERVEVNNFFASRLNINNRLDFDGLNWVSYRSVFHESSRSRAKTIDKDRGADLVNRPATPFFGEHQFMDMNVRYGNSYFYRIRSVALDGKSSDWIFRGIRLSDEWFERRSNFFLTQDDRQNMVNSSIPFVLRGWDDLEVGDDSFSLNPGFSRPNMNSMVTRDPVNHSLSPRPLPTHPGNKEDISNDMRSETLGSGR